MSDPQWAIDLVEELSQFARPENPNRAVLAHLRRGIDHGLDYPLARIGWLFQRVPESREEILLRSAILAAGLFAWVKGDCPHILGVNFGAAFGSGPLEHKQQREKRFIDLLDTDVKELAYKLRQAVTLIARDGVGLDWVRLIKHLRYWDDPDRRVQIEWARGFWSTSEPEPNVTVQQTVSE